MRSINRPKLTAAYFGKPRTSSPPVFTPPRPAHLQLWLKADALALADGAAVATWADSGTRGNDATAGRVGGIAAPRFAIAGIGGKPAVAFDGTMGLDTPFNQALGDFCAFLVFKPTGHYGGAFDTVLDKNYAGGFWLGRYVASTQWTFGVAEPGSPYGLANDGADGTPYLASLFRSGTARTYKLNSATAANAVTGAVTDRAHLSLGYHATDGGGGNRFLGLIAELLLYDAVITGSDEAAVESYLKSKYSIS